jgi:hypothetical protein
MPPYIYNPDVSFQQADNSKRLTLPGGLNGPVGSVWIDLSKPTYGIHGTPEPSLIGKSESRLRSPDELGRRGIGGDAQTGGRGRVH